MTRKRDIKEIIQGIASLGILYYILFSDRSRMTEEWFAAVPHNFLTSAPAFLFWMLLIYFTEGAKAAECGPDAGKSPVRFALRYYISYWKFCIPLVLLGFCFFSQHRESPLYCPMFVNLGFLNLSRAAVALTNNIHEGTWLVSSIAICAFCTALYFRLKDKKGRMASLLPLAGCIVVQCGLYLVVLPFMYHKTVFRVAAISGSICYMLGFLLFQLPAMADNTVVRALSGLSDNRRAELILKPLGYIGHNWLAFWMAMFYVTCYYYSIAATVHAILGHGLLCYLAFVLLTFGLLKLIEWIYATLARSVKQSPRSVISVLLLIAASFLLYRVLETSMNSYAQFAHSAARQWPVYTLVNVLSIFCLIAILAALIGHWLPAGLTITVLMTLLSVANYYTMKYHGALLTVEDIHNVKTAAGVIDSYDLSVDAVSGKILLLGAGAAACCVLSCLARRGHRTATHRTERWLRRGAALLLSALCLFMFFFAPAPVVERDDNIWSWHSLYAKIGFLSGTVESTMANLSFSVYKPEGYSAENIERLASQAEQALQNAEPVTTQDYPDIVMILNETYYNLDLYMDTNADVDYMKNYNALGNAVKGYAEVPLTGGGTNGTEYEMLTGNSMSLINAYAPFNRLNFTDTVSLPGYLKQLGYNTIGAHPHESQNYHRGTSWAQMGIDRNYFIRDFTDVEFYAKRKNDHQITDTSALKNLIRFMEDMPEDKPRFAFLATMQNHGGWTTNAPEDALVHCSPDTQDEDLVNKINEYLSCLTFTDDMIAYMQEYYEALYARTGRRVIVCMVGDHSPSFIPSLEGLCKWPDAAEAERKGKMTPYYIWANYPIDADALGLAGAEDMDLCCLMPAVLKVAGVPLSYYYQYILDMNREVAVYTNVGSESAEESKRIAFYSRNGELHYVDEALPLAQTVRDYMYMEYNLNGDDAEQEPVIFQPMGVDIRQPARSGDG